MKLFCALSFSLFLFLGCVTNPDYPRVNTNDPGSDLFSPRFYNLSARFITDGTVSVTWLDQTDFEAGYLVMKKLGDSYVEILDTLPPSLQGSYLDTNLQFDLPTEYIVSSFMIRDDTISIGTSDTTNLFLGSLADLTTSNNSETVLLSWANNIRIDHKIALFLDGESLSTLPKGSNNYQIDISGLNSPIVPAAINRFPKLQQID